MIEVKEVLTYKQKKAFVDFPIKLYKNNPYFVPCLRVDEMNLFNPKKNVSYEDSEAKYFLAYKDKKVVGRIAGIVQHLFNDKTGEKRLRFSRFDSINDQEVANALFAAVEKYAKEVGMEIIHGPLGFNDLEREGLLIEGFDQPQTFEEQYNYDYYQKLIEGAGYGKEIDYVEYKIFPLAKRDERIDRIANAVLKRNNLHLGTAKNMSQFVNKYKDGIFNVIDEVYAPLYGVVPYTDKVRDQIVSQFKLFLNKKYFCVVCDENEKVVAFGFAIPSVSKVIQKTKGRILHPKILGIFKAVKKPKILDLALIGVLPEYRAKGVNAVVLQFMMNALCTQNLKYVETNLNLENNALIQNSWKNFPNINHKRRRCFIKNLNT